MVKILAAVAVAILIVAGLFVFRGCGDPDARAIRRSLSEAVEIARVEARESQLVAAARARSLGRFVTPDITFGNRTLPVAIQSRENLMMAVLHSRTLLNRFIIETHDVELDLRSDRLSALMTLSAKVTADGPAGPETVWKNVRMEWVKQDDLWLISRVQAVEPIEQPR